MRLTQSSDLADEQELERVDMLNQIIIRKHWTVCFVLHNIRPLIWQQYNIAPALVYIVQ